MFDADYCAGEASLIKMVDDTGPRMTKENCSLQVVSVCFLSLSANPSRGFDGMHVRMGLQ
jgi:hypothetical protein